MSEHDQEICPECGGPLETGKPCPSCLLQMVSQPTDALDDLSIAPETPDAASATPDIDAVQNAFPQLEVIERVGRGGMGTVFKARQPKLNRFVALKILTAPAPSSTFAERFLREAQLLARLSHPNIVTVYDFGQSGGFYYLMMEFVDGVNLRQAIRSEHFTPEQTLSIVPKICEALQYAHEEGVLHRDIKPENILLDTRGRVKIADFGIACLNTATTGRSSQDSVAANDEKLTQTGQILGTPNYMAPEQIERPSEVDHRADIYSLGVVFYELLTGELPLGRFAPPSEKSDTSPNVDRIVLKALEKERERRQQSAGEMKTEIEDLPSEVAALRSRWSLAGIVAEVKTWPIWATILVVCVAGPMALYVPVLVIAMVVGSVLFVADDGLRLHENWPIISPLITPIGLVLLVILGFAIRFYRRKQKKEEQVHAQPPDSTTNFTASLQTAERESFQPRENTNVHGPPSSHSRRFATVALGILAIVPILLCFYFFLKGPTMNPDDIIPFVAVFSPFACLAFIVLVICITVVLVNRRNTTGMRSDFNGDSATLFCTHCGNKLDGNAFACPKCGYATRAERNYCFHCGIQTDPKQVMCVQCGTALGSSNPILHTWVNGKKDRLAAALFALLLGWIGIHKFYLGSWGWGLLYLLFSWSTIPFLVSIVEGIVFLVMSDQTFDLRYNQTRPSPFRW